MRVGVGADHAGFRYKERVKDWLRQRGHEVVDFGTDSEKAVDYPLYVRPVARAVASGEIERGLVFGGSGNGEAIVANRVPGVRCAYCWNEVSARLGREHNDANMIALGERLVDLETTLRIVDIFVNTPFQGGRHRQRIRLIDEVDQREDPA
ncbi:MAG: ribose 5-phosphate isomerase B [Candidatus Hydrogenedentes bacterium]|nr:ribose 5-phosphate isomerase B [Candidatus Hydrogenedentota bacterium]